jgi:hypothetical protein
VHIIWFRTSQDCNLGILKFYYGSWVFSGTRENWRGLANVKLQVWCNSVSMKVYIERDDTAFRIFSYHHYYIFTIYSLLQAFRPILYLLYALQDS